MATQSEIKRVKNEIRKQENVWQEQMADNWDRFNIWLNKIAETLHLTVNIVNHSKELFDYLQGLLGY